MHIETDAAPDLEPPRVVDGRTLVKAGLRPPPPAAIGLDKGPAIDKSRCREIEGQERAASPTPVRPTTKRDGKPLFAKEKMIAQVRSAIRLRDSGKGKRLTRLAGEQNQKERTFDVLPKPANLISYRQKFVERVGSCAASDPRVVIVACEWAPNFLVFAVSSNGPAVTGKELRLDRERIPPMRGRLAGSIQVRGTPAAMGTIGARHPLDRCPAACWSRRTLPGSPSALRR